MLGEVLTVNDFRVYMNWDGTLSIYDYVGELDAEKIIVPGEIGEYKITNLSKGCFDGCKNVKKIILHKNIMNIDDYAFNNCEELKEIVLPMNLISIGDYAFNQCYSLEKIILEDTVRNIGKGAFAHCYSLEEVVISKNVGIIRENTFLYCDCIKRITWPSHPIVIDNCGLDGDQIMTTTTINLNKDTLIRNEIWISSEYIGGKE